MNLQHKATRVAEARGPRGLSAPREAAAHEAGSTAERQGLAESIAASPAAVRQRRQWGAMFGPAAQLTAGPAVVQRVLNAKLKKLLDPLKATIATLATDEDRWDAIKNALDPSQGGTDQNILDGAKYLKTTATKRTVAPVLPTGPVTPFVSLQADVDDGLYTVSTAGAKIRYGSAEGPFAKEYSGGVSVEDAVEGAIAGLSVDEDTRTQFARHDHQPSGKDTNLQVQLGGSRAYRPKKGDTSSTLVVVKEALWKQLIADKPRLKLVLQAAHRQSFANSQRVELGPPG